MTSQGPALAWCPFPDEAIARTVIDSLLEEGLIACANIVPEMTSIYVWNGKKGEAREVGAMLKTDAAMIGALVERLGSLHPYDEPAIVAWRCDGAAKGTAAWLASLVK